MPKGSAPGNTNAVGNSGGGRTRPTYDPRYPRAVSKMCELGATDLDICQALGISTDTLDFWRVIYTEFAAALKIGKDIPDERVKRSLYNRAIGYTYKAEEIYIIDGEVVRVDVMKHMPPEPRAAAIWLNNRCRGEFGAPSRHEIAGPDGKSPLMLIDARSAILAELTGVEKRLKNEEE